MFANAFNDPEASAYESYTFSITPSRLPFPQCGGDAFKANEQANVLQAIQAMCASDVCFQRVYRAEGPIPVRQKYYLGILCDQSAPSEL